MMDMRQEGMVGNKGFLIKQVTTMGKENSITEENSENHDSEVTRQRGRGAGVFIHQFSTGSGCFQGN